MLMMYLVANTVLAACGPVELAHAASLFDKAVAVDVMGKNINKLSAHQLNESLERVAPHLLDVPATYVVPHKTGSSRGTDDDSFDGFYYEYHRYMERTCGAESVPPYSFEEGAPPTSRPIAACDADAVDYNEFWEATIMADDENHLLALQSHGQLFESRDGGVSWGLFESGGQCLAYIDRFADALRTSGPVCFLSQLTFSDIPAAYCYEAQGTWQLQAAWTGNNQWLEDLRVSPHDFATRYGVWVAPKGGPGATAALVVTQDAGGTWAYPPAAVADAIELGGLDPDGRIMAVLRDTRNSVDRLVTVHLTDPPRTVDVPWDTRSNAITMLMVNPGNAAQVQVVTVARRTGEATTWQSTDAGATFIRSATTCREGAWFSDAQGTTVCLVLGPRSHWGALQIEALSGAKVLFDLPGKDPRLLAARGDRALVQVGMRLLRLDNLSSGAPRAWDITPSRLQPR